MPSACARSQLGAHGGEIERLLDRAVGAHALVDLDHALVEHLGLDDVLGEDLRPRLVADAQRVAEALGGDSSVRSPLRSSSALVATVVPIFTAPIAPGGIGSPGLQAEQVADALHGGVAIGLRILGQELVRDQRAVRPPPDHVGEGAAAVDPEIPSVLRLACFMPVPIAIIAVRRPSVMRRRSRGASCADFLDRLYLFSGYLAGAFLIAIFVLMMVLSAGRPLGFNIPAGDDFVSWCMAATAFLGLAHTFRPGEMIRVGLLIDRLPEREPALDRDRLRCVIGIGFIGFFAWLRRAS